MRSSVTNPVEVFQAVLAKYSRVVLFSRDARELEGLLEPHFPPGLQVFRFVRATTKLTAFHAVPTGTKAILLAEYGNADIGVSIKTEAAILVEADRLSPQRLYQIISRLLRITNQIDRIEATIIYHGTSMLVGRVKLALARIKRAHDLTFESGTFVHRAEAGLSDLITKLGKDPDGLSDLELLFLAHPTCKRLVPHFQTAGVDPDGSLKPLIVLHHREFKKRCRIVKGS